MSKYEKLGNFLLFEKIEEDRLSKNFLAGQIANNQIQEIQVIKKFDPSLSTLPDFVLDLNQEFEIVKSLANPNIVRPNSFVREKSEFAAVFDYVEGKSLRAILNRCQQDGYPFTADHALLIGSRLCTALEYLHSKKANAERLLHGFVSPETIFVTYDGEIKLQYLGLMQALMKFSAGRDKLVHDFKAYLAPEVLQNQKLDKSADVYSAGLVLFEMLTGEPLFGKSREINVSKAIDDGQLFLTSGDRAPLPADIKGVLNQALSMNPSARFSAIADMRKALDQILFTSDYSPTTFNLAFFMNTLFRENIDQEHKNVASLKKMDIAPYLKEEPPAPVNTRHPVGAEAAKDISAIPLAFSKEDALGERQMFGGADLDAKEKSKMPLILAAAGGVVVIGLIAFFLFKPSGTNTPQTAQAVKSMSPNERQADAAERQKLQEDAQKAQDEAKQKDLALKELQAKLDAMMKQQQKQQKENPTAAPTVDAAAIQQLQEQARKLEEEKKRQQALAEEKLKAAQQAPVQFAPPPDTTAQQQPQQQPAEQKPAEQKPVQVASATPGNIPPPSTASNNPAPQPVQPSPAAAENSDAKSPAVKEGDVVDLTPDVVKPELTNRTNPAYPPAAQHKRIEGTVILSVLISERGDVSDVKLLRGAGGSSGLNEAAEQAIKQWKFRPAVKDGKRVKVWVTYPIVFKLQ